MGQIRCLDSDTINKIAAGEVVESSHSVLKELIENSLDAGATRIWIETEAGGLKKILVQDNGHGILKEDLPLVVERYATSKIATVSDLEMLQSYGFRGEAVASIASVSRLRIRSGVVGERFAYELEAESGKLASLKEVSHFEGTVVEVTDLFYNAPVRRKFTKSVESEDRKNKIRVQISALSRPDVGFCYVQNAKEILRVSPGGLRERILSLFGENLDEHLIPVQNERNRFSVSGFISGSGLYRSNRLGQFFFVNGRPVEIRNSSFLLKKAYGELLPTGAHPWCFLYFQIPPERMDVNVHPQKKEIRFLDEEFFTGFLLSTLQGILHSSSPVGFWEMKHRISNSAFSMPPSSEPKSPFHEEFLHPSLIPQPSKREGFDLDEAGAGVRLGDLNPQFTKHPEFLPKRHFGVVFETFILAEAEDGLYIIDQHTAHERIRYEEVLNALRTKSYGIQPLLSPIRLDFSREEAQEIFSRSEGLLELGIKVEDFGDGSILVREVPGYLEPGREREVILEFIDRFLDGEELEPYDLMAKCVACKTSIRKGSQLSDVLIAEILNRLSYAQNPARCPHGRPTLVRLTREDLEKMFHRK